MLDQILQSSKPLITDAFLVNMIGWIKKLLGFSPKDASKERSIYTKDFLGNFYQIGDYTYGLPSIKHWGEKATLKIGKFCSIATNVTIFLGGNHRTDWISTYPFSVINQDFPNANGIEGHPSTKGNVSIENDVWIGTNATIMSGITIHNGAVIAANAVVTKDVPPYAIVAGNPAKIVKFRFSQVEIEQLQKISWWNWPIEKINTEVKKICNPDISTFLKEFSDNAI